MFSTDDTIVAIATPLGRSGVGIVRLSGPRSASIVAALVGRSSPLRPRHATFARLAASAPRADLRSRPLPPPAAQEPPTGSALKGGVRSGLPLPSSPSPPGVSSAAAVRDQVVVTVFPGPQSYTGEDVAEISAHGSPVVLQGILRAALVAGARLAEPGEFTLRAFLNGKLDLVQAEAVADLIDAVTPLQARAAFDQLEGTLTVTIREIESALFDLMARLEASLDFPDEGYHFVQADAAAREIAGVRSRIGELLSQASRGRLIREGAQIAILGTPNVGKSSLFNALINANRAIVTAIPGTTRDLLTERADIRGFSVALVDTAGIRDSTDVVEQEGVARARQAASIADLTVLLLDRSRRLGDDDRALLNATDASRRIIVVNKIDLPAVVTPDPVWNAIEVSVMTGAGLDDMIDRMAALLGAGDPTRDHPLVTNVRHIALLEHARDALGRALRAVAPSGLPADCHGVSDDADADRPNDFAEPVSEEFVLADLQEAAGHLQEITGRRTTEDLLHHIFATFCIGK